MARDKEPSDPRSHRPRLQKFLRHAPSYRRRTYPPSNRANPDLRDRAPAVEREDKPHRCQGAGRSPLETRSGCPGSFGPPFGCAPASGCRHRGRVAWDPDQGLQAGYPRFAPRGAEKEGLLQPARRRPARSGGNRGDLGEAGGRGDQRKICQPALRRHHHASGPFGGRGPQAWESVSCSPEERSC